MTGLRILRSLALAALLALAACSFPPETSEPLAEPGQVRYDPRLVGIWTLSYLEEDTAAPFDEEEIGLIALRLAPDPEQEGSLRAVLMAVPWLKGDHPAWLSATAYATEVDGRFYYNVRRVAGVGDDYSALGGEPGYLILQAEVTGDDRLVVRGMNGKLLADLLAQGRVRPEQDEAQEDRAYLLLRLSASELVALLRETTPERLFVEIARLRRVRPSEESRGFGRGLGDWMLPSE